jgi:hypothetical protein
MGLFALDGILTWQSVCRSDRWLGVAFHTCLTARIWQGDGALLGLLAEVAAGVLLVAFASRAFAKRPFPRRWEWPLLVIWVVVAGARKLVGAGQGSTGAGALGVVLLIIATVAAAATLVSAKTPRRRSAAVGVALSSILAGGVVIALSVVYGSTGLARWGGPLAYSDPLGGSVGTGNHVPPRGLLPLYGTLYANNHSRVAVRIDGVELVDPSPGLRVQGIFTLKKGPYVACPTRVPITRGGERLCFRPVAGVVVPHAPSPASEIEIVPVVTTQSQGKYSVGGFVIHYHVGPLHFSAYQLNTAVICVSHDVTTPFNRC